jgi:hypothetical protein
MKGFCHLQIIGRSKSWFVHLFFFFSALFLGRELSAQPSYQVPAGPTIAADSTYIVSTAINGTAQSTQCDQVAPGAGSIQNIYSSYLNQPSIANFVRGGAGIITVDVAQCNLVDNSSSRIAVYVDFNRDGDFDDPGEEVYESPVSSLTPYTETFTFAIPALSELGLTAVRVIAAETEDDITPSLVFDIGEVEDHVVTIVNPVVANDLIGVAKFVNTTAFPTCGSVQAFNLEFASNSPQTNFLGNDIWYRFTAKTNAVRIQLSGANDMALELHNSGGVVATENVVAATGNEALIYDQLTAGVTYWVAVIAVGSPGTGTICFSHLRRSGCSAPSSFSPETLTSPCQIFKCAHTAASSYTAYFDDDGVAPFIGTSVATGGTTYHPISGFSGLPPMTDATSYLVRVDATYNLSDAAGNPVTAVVPGSFACTRTIGQQPDVFLSNNDAAPNVRPGNALVAANRWLCGASFYQWQIQRYDEIGGDPVEPFPAIINGTGVNRRIFLGSLFPVPNGIYKVNITPIFPLGPGNTGPDRWLLISGPAMTVLTEDTPDNAASRALNMSVYPNPSDGTYATLSISGVSANTQLRVLDGMGRVVWRNNVAVENELTRLIEFDRPLASGLYTVELMAEGIVINRRLLVQK